MGDPHTRVAKLRTRKSDSELVPTLTMLEGPQTGAFFAFDPGRRAHRVGRLEDADIRLDDPSVSRVHAICIVSSRDGHLGVRIEDNGSTNGVLVNGRAVEFCSLISGDKVRLGDILLRFEWMAEEEIRYSSDVFERLRAAERDHLTGLLTRLFLETRLPHILREVARRGQQVVCLLMDLDHFKTINDVHGHLVGDAVIRQAAGALTGVLRETDHAIRYGGEEFLVIMPGLSLEQARPVADRIRAAIAGLGLDSGGPGVQVTSSIGIAERSGSEPLVDWIARADRAMYEAKDAGRDRVGLAPTPPPAPLPRSGGDPASETVPGTRTDDDDAADVITRDLDGS